MGQAPSKLAPPPLLVLPVPGVKFTGPSGTSCTWADVYTHCSLKTQKAILDAFNLKYKDKLVHWHGTLLNVDPNTNSVLFKMSPAVNQGAMPDLALHFPQSFSVTQLQPLIKMHEMKTIDFVGKLQGMNGPVFAVDYVAVGGGYVPRPEHNLPKPIIDALHTIPEAFPSVAALEPQLTIEYLMVAMDCSMQARGIPEAIFMRKIATSAGFLSCQVSEVTSQGAKVKCNPRVDERAPFDVMVTFPSKLTPGLTEIKPGALCTFRGKYTTISTLREPQKPFGFAAEDATVNKDPSANLTTLPTKGGDIVYQPQDEAVVKSLRAQIEADRQLHRKMRGTTSYGQPAPTPATASAPTPPQPSQSSDPQAIPPTEPEKPVSKEEPSKLPETVVEEPPQAEEVKLPVIEETVSDVAGKDPLEVALTLMQSAPEASYTVKKSILEADEQDDDPVARIARLKMGGFNASVFTSSADKYMGELDMLAGVKPTVTTDYETYDVANDYNNNNDYNNYNYDNYSSGGGGYDSYSGYGGGYSSW